MSSRTVPGDIRQRVLLQLAASRFVTVSLLIHTIIVLLAGGTALYRVAVEPPDFEAGAEGILLEDTEQPRPPELATYQPSDVFAPQAPALAVPLTALTTASLQTPTWTAAAAANAPMPGISDSMKGGLASLGDRLPQGGGTNGGAMGRPGGMRSGMIFGKKIQAARLGVILDVSGSGWPHLPGAISEIQNSFSDAILILYPGCGMAAFEGESGHEIRKYSSIPKKELEAACAVPTTLNYLRGALKVAEFEKMTRRPAFKDALFVSWYGKMGADGKVVATDPRELVGRPQSAFEELIKRGVDNIYWFGDFADGFDPRAVDRLSEQLINRHVKLHVHNFAGKKIHRLVTAMAEKSGGTVNVEKPTQAP